MIQCLLTPTTFCGLFVSFFNLFFSVLCEEVLCPQLAASEKKEEKRLSVLFCSTGGVIHVRNSHHMLYKLCVFVFSVFQQCVFLRCAVLASASSGQNQFYNSAIVTSKSQPRNTQLDKVLLRTISTALRTEWSSGRAKNGETRRECHVINEMWSLEVCRRVLCWRFEFLLTRRLDERRKVSFSECSYQRQVCIHKGVYTHNVHFPGNILCLPTSTLCNNLPFFFIFIKMSQTCWRLKCLSAKESPPTFSPPSEITERRCFQQICSFYFELKWAGALCIINLLFFWCCLPSWREGSTRYKSSEHEWICQNIWNWPWGNTQQYMIKRKSTVLLNVARLVKMAEVQRTETCGCEVTIGSGLSCLATTAINH